MAEQRTVNTKKKRSINLWKWACLVLIGLIFGALIWLFVQLQPVNVGEENTESLVTNEDDLVFQVSTTKADVTRLTNEYLRNELDDQYAGFNFSLEDSAELSGEIEVFGFPIEFSLFMTPYVLENGNLQLRGDSINIGSLNLPISFAMSQLARQVDFPEWIVIDSENQFIIVNLNEFELDNGARFSADRINLEEDDIQFNIHLPLDAVK
ncbi:YpmS family protein [Marinilactibacillus kalidii]|uniref:YpmS family protein n=1 Tax=Marinilactibacillus kalidii TaxID=2820274 RepID=UPI001ABDEE1D|nr:YpmS family protein [Marinilactibacillus kalidii]